MYSNVRNKQMYSRVISVSVSRCVVIYLLILLVNAPAALAMAFINDYQHQVAMGTCDVCSEVVSGACCCYKWTFIYLL